MATPLFTDPQGAFLVVDKPEGPTSHDIVGAVRRLLHTRAVGHAGTLDPFASGVLVVLCGELTRLADIVGEGTKRYRAVARLGVRTDTDDLTGKVISRSDEPVADDALVGALARLVGTQLQVPPSFSAKHVKGQRAHELARSGEHVELPASLVDVKSLALIERRGMDVTFDVGCGRGTYIRAIARDLGIMLGVGAHLVALRRTAVGAFVEAASTRLDALTLEAAHPARAIAAYLPHVVVSVEEAHRIMAGNALTSGRIGEATFNAGRHGVVICDEGLVAIARATRELVAGAAVGAADVDVGRRFPQHQ